MSRTWNSSSMIGSKKGSLARSATASLCEQVLQTRWMTSFLFSPYLPVSILYRWELVLNCAIRLLSQYPRSSVRYNSVPKVSFTNKVFYYLIFQCPRLLQTRFLSLSEPGSDIRTIFYSDVRDRLSGVGVY